LVRGLECAQGPDADSLTRATRFVRQGRRETRGIMMMME